MRRIITLFAAVVFPFVCTAQTVTYLHTDINGNVVAESDEDGNVIARYSFDPYGLPQTPISDGPGFTGHNMDGDSGLIYMQQRYYDPLVGRFLSVDPMGVDSSNAWNFNRYNYAANNPMSNRDPTGGVCINGYNLSSPMCLRSIYYERLHADPRISNRTSFFGAAAIITSALALPEQGAFMADLSAKLAHANIARANQIIAGGLYRGSSIGRNDVDFIHFEQTLVQKELDGLKASDVAGYNSLISDTNNALNGLAGGRGVAWVSDPNVARAVASARETIGGDIDFGNQSHREALGQAAAEIARESRSVCTGSHFRRC